MAATVFLVIQALLFIPYGLYCLLQPEMLAGAAGVAATSLTGEIELRTMYGGLQIAVGAFCALAVMRPALHQPAMVTLCVVFAGLAPVRVGLGLAMGDFSGYTLFAMTYEAICLVYAIWWLRGRDHSAG